MSDSPVKDKTLGRQSLSEGEASGSPVKDKTLGRQSLSEDEASGSPVKGKTLGRQSLSEGEASGSEWSPRVAVGTLQPQSAELPMLVTVLPPSVDEIGIKPWARIAHTIYAAEVGTMEMETAWLLRSTSFLISTPSAADNDFTTITSP